MYKGLVGSVLVGRHKGNCWLLAWKRNILDIDLGEEGLTSSYERKIRSVVYVDM